MEFTLSQADKKLLADTARETIKAKLSGRKPVYKPHSETLEKKCGAFVTLHKNGELRGCIGHLVGIRPLYVTIREMALASAFDDPRFTPVEKSELDSIEIEISVLSPMSKIKSIDEVKAGLHGVYIRKGLRTGTLLPQVALEQGWNTEELVGYACLKAGLDKNAWKEESTEIFIYTAVVFGEKEEVKKAI
ncbi:MAG: AmmeMemoRadiSam system protein A [Spirochaetia bacterium]|jgi:AmmeMemoRadiSam system protein A|nr:AmmeMemoRadiSam system protein A [Spirochaetia bacterium]